MGQIGNDIEVSLPIWRCRADRRMPRILARRNGCISTTAAVIIPQATVLFHVHRTKSQPKVVARSNIAAAEAFWHLLKALLSRHEPEPDGRAPYLCKKPALGWGKRVWELHHSPQPRGRHVWHIEHPEMRALVRRRLQCGPDLA